MTKITGKDLIKLGFTKEKERSSIAPNLTEKYHYYVYDVDNSTLLVSNTNDEKKGGYEVEFYDIQGLIFKDLKHLKKLVKLLNQATHEYR
jgi:hypothetical protein